MTHQLLIADTSIKTDAEGRYCLNDLHRAAGGESRHQPAFFMKRPETVELLAELNSSAQQISPVESKRGRSGGTFVCKQLVYTYAMWVSAKFHMKVVDFFDRGQTQGIAVADHAADDLLTNPLAYFEKVLAQAKQLQAERDLALTNAPEVVQKVRLLTL
ncbi:hypothetical protein HPA02_03030 [Bisbaumannia pacifica]|uniref:KilA-N domain-containing protein n=1 Tax=Bisbaumannia pacifica TaxID=77098 RepID=A0A510XBV8_9GAMM|nr:KilA-N domain-containing protein [Halomonas pacifica]GEK46020.1 hypothetical protein HPA02_03030 [Halomonas pacifica]